ncbi:MAG TPA: hypothetical protein DCX54_06510 [Flavobacteriales bacterium]|nr:hypothetical protein [Flavobacteriales bacterium]
MDELSEDVKQFLFPGNEDVEMYSHRTISKEIADKIISDGFKYYDSFQKTTDEIINDMVYLRYWDTLRKHYGGHIVVIAISRELLRSIQKEIHPKYEAQQVLSTPLIDFDENNGDEMRYILPKQYVKGYIDRHTGEITRNKEYNPSYTPPGMEGAIKQLYTS